MATSAAADGAVVAAIDRASLAQALLDFEVANARVLDLTGRLVEANQRVRQLHADAAARHAAEASRDDAVAHAAAATSRAERADADAGSARRERDELDAELSRLRHAHHHVVAERDAIRASRSYRLASRLARLPRAVGRPLRRLLP